MAKRDVPSLTGGERMVSRGRTAQWAVTLNDGYSGEYQLLKVVRGRIAEIGCFFRREFWGQGCAFELWACRFKNIKTLHLPPFPGDFFMLRYTQLF